MPKTYDFQEQLQTLPLSNLDDASKNFLDWVKPLLTNEQFNTTKKNLESLVLEEGPILHKKLEEYSKQNDGSWLAPLWKDMYLDLRESPAIDVNYFAKLITEHLKSKYKSSEIAGVLITKFMDIYEEISSETFEPETIRGTPICMAAYKEMFKATSIPKLNSDEYIVKPKSKKNHILVMYKNHMFKMDLTNEKGQRHSYKMIVNTLETLLKSNLEMNDTSVGVITTTNRDNAAVLLEEIITIEKNSEHLEIIKDALFSICIDENTKGIYDFGMSLIGTNENNRYFDKNLQLIFNTDGDFGFNLEHTSADAGPWISIINMAYEELSNIDKYLEDKSTESIQIERLDWELSKELKDKLNEVRSEHIKKVEDLQFEILNLDFGTSKIKSFKYSPDAFLHLALQLAQYRTFNKLRSTYEAVSTRAYRNGRTECTRPISMEVLEFVKTFDNQETDISTLKELMTKACQKHSSRIKDCLGSNGVERYFFAMKNMYSKFSKELELKEEPLFFNDEGYKKLTYSFISTSRIESKYFNLGGFGPVVHDGYGFWYNLLEDQINMNLITRKSVNKDYATVFGESIIKSVNDLVQLASK